MSEPGITFSELEERLASPEAGEAIKACEQMISALSERLRSQSSGHHPVARYRRIEAALLAIEAASEVVCKLRPTRADAAPNPFQTGPDQIRDPATRKPTP
ncbi:MAG: hypothetical protein KGR68_06435 [Betaproteobacteria bacterium]|nr:hypothetical protein [Betaproteobacteria bacterium]